MLLFTPLHYVAAATPLHAAVRSQRIEQHHAIRHAAMLVDAVYYAMIRADISPAAMLYFLLR